MGFFNLYYIIVYRFRETEVMFKYFGGSYIVTLLGVVAAYFWGEHFHAGTGGIHVPAGGWRHCWLGDCQADCQVWSGLREAGDGIRSIHEGRLPKGRNRLSVSFSLIHICIFSA